MLSTENPPSDPLPISNLNSVVSNDKLANSSDLDPTLDYQNHHNPPTNFSIRDHVFAARSKDITKNWPFSLKTLQLCLRNGLKDPLPPFQSVDAVRHQSSESCTAKPPNTIFSNDEQKPLVDVINHHPKLDNDRLKQKVSDTSVHVDPITTSTSRAENDIPSTSASVYQSGVETVPSVRPSEADQTVLEGSTAQTSLSRKTETNKPLTKKCRLIVKFGAFSERSSTEDITSNCTAVSELMASKTCPVCKIFSSSSNTTLNAHIDQCLSSDSTTKWGSDTKSYRHKIKPRKTKFLADIYSTAKPCTLEELDRRNGTSWAAISSFPTQESDNLEECDEAVKQKVSTGHPAESPSDVDRVYIDANGTKLRILSKLGDSPMISQASKGVGPSKGGKGSRCFLTKKKSRHGKKRHKYLKLAPQSRKLQKAYASQALEEPEGFSGDGSRKKGLLKLKQSKHGQPGNLGQWASSKGSGIELQQNKQGCKRYVIKNPPAGTNQSYVDDSLARVNQVQKLPQRPTGNAVYPSESNCTTWMTLDQAHKIGKRKRPRGSLMEARTLCNTGRPVYAVKFNKDQPGKVGPSCHEGPTLRPRLASQKKSPFLSKKTMSHDAINLSDASPRFRSKALRSSSLGKMATTFEAGCSSIKLSGLKRARSCNVVETDEGQAAAQVAMDQDCDMMHSENHGECRNDWNGRLCSRQISAEFPMPQRDDAVASNAPHLVTQHNVKDNGEAGTDEDDDDDDDYVNSSEDDEDNDDDDDDNILDQANCLLPSTGIATSLSESLGVDFKRMRTSSKAQSDRPESSENHHRDFCGSESYIRPSDRGLFSGQEVYSSSHGVGKEILGQTAHIVMEFGTGDVGHGNSFTEVDPIPIPGPPGSFLPSPRDMCSDDFAGNSSLTSSRVQSSHDQLDLADRNSSESPISAASTISNSTADKSNHMKYEENQTMSGVSSIQEKATLGFPSNTGSTGGSSRETSSEAGITFNVERLSVNKFSAKKKSFGSKNDDQPCSCQKKERFSRGLSLNCQNSELMRRRMMSSVTVPAEEIQTGPNRRSIVDDVDKGSDIVVFSSCPVSEPGKVTAPLMNPSGEPAASKRSPDSINKSTGHVDFASPSPSPSNPVLRLMGKNLMVVNKGEDAPLPLGHNELNYQSNHTTQCTAVPNVSACGDTRSFYQMPPRGSLIYGQDPCDAAGVFNLRNGAEYRSNSVIQQDPAQFLADAFANQCIDSRFATAMNGQTCVDDFSLWNTGPDWQRNKTGLHSDTSDKKIFASDDVPDGGPVVYSQNLRINHSFCEVIPMNQSQGSRHRSFASFQRYGSAVHAAQQSSDSHALRSREANTSPVRWGSMQEGSVRWGCMQEGSVSMHRDPRMAASTSSSGHVSPAVYHSPRPS